MRLIQVAWVVALTLGLASLPGGGLAASPQRQQQRVETPEAQGANSAAPGPVDIAVGKEAFEGHCASCHGVDGVGGDGPNLRGIVSFLGADNVMGVVRRGVPGTEMPSFVGAAGNEIADVVAYVATLGAPAAEAATGDPQRGQQLFSEKGCSGCHIVSGQGGILGPELTRIGAMRGPSNLHQALVNPGTDLPKQGVVGIDRGRFTQYLMFRVVTNDGKTTEGMRMSEDSLGIVLKDLNGQYHTFSKVDLKSFEKEPGKSFMPNYTDLQSSAELDDLVAYLASLKGTK